MLWTVHVQHWVSKRKNKDSISPQNTPILYQYCWIFLYTSKYCSSIKTCTCTSILCKLLICQGEIKNLEAFISTNDAQRALYHMCWISNINIFYIYIQPDKCGYMLIYNKMKLIVWMLLIHFKWMTKLVHIDPIVHMILQSVDSHLEGQELWVAPDWPLWLVVTLSWEKPLWHDCRDVIDPLKIWQLS